MKPYQQKTLSNKINRNNNIILPIAIQQYVKNKKG